MSLGVHISAPKSSAKALVYRYSPSQLEPSPRVCGAEARRQLVPQAPGRTAVPPGALSAEKQAGGGGEGGGAGSGQGEGTGGKGIGGLGREGGLPWFQGQETPAPPVWKAGQGADWEPGSGSVT